MFKTYKLTATLTIEMDLYWLNKEQAVDDWLRAYPLPVGYKEDSLNIISVTPEAQWGQ